jgi:hypothetical protein
MKAVFAVVTASTIIFCFCIFVFYLASFHIAFIQHLYIGVAGQATCEAT